MATRVDTICAFHTTRSFGSCENLVARSQEANQAYRELTEAEIAEIVQRSVAERGRLIDALVSLACLRHAALKPFQRGLLDAGIIYPGLIYHDASEECAAILAEKVSSFAVEILHRNHLLLCMAWVGNAEVRRHFIQWRIAPPAWARELHVPPHIYAEEAGWELLPSGERRDLFIHTTRPLVKPIDAPEFPTGVGVAVPAGHHCRWCGRQLMSILDIEPHSESATILGSAGTGLRMLACCVCTCFGTIFSKAVDGEDFGWHPSSTRPEYLPDDANDWTEFPTRPLSLSGVARHYMESASWTMVPGVSFSQLGGLPTWIQGADYPDCPDCATKMRFIGQISNEDFDPLMEGIEYCFHCPQCNVTATSYQQS